MKLVVRTINKLKRLIFPLISTIKQKGPIMQRGSVRLSRINGTSDFWVEVVDKNGKTIAKRNMEVSYEALVYLSEYCRDKKTVLDVGAGELNQTTVMRALGFDVTTVDPIYPADIPGDVLTVDIPNKYDIIFCSHVLEHQRNIGLFLDRIISLCRPDGILCITVPPEISPYFLLCHPNQFSGGLLLYHLILAGIDCREAKVLTYGYNVSVIVQNKKNPLALQSFAHEEEALPYFPEYFQKRKRQLFGPVKSINWETLSQEQPHMNAGL